MNFINKQFQIPETQETIDKKYMNQALSLAKKAMSYTKTNPMVGCVITKDNKVIGKGYHHEFGGDHAEIDAIKNATESIEGSTIYVTLEPCFHQGKKPPCVKKIIKEKPARVVIAMEDPNPKVAGQSIKLMQEHGIRVDIGVREYQARELNEAFIHYITTNTPFVCMKTAMSLDGKIATYTGDSKWISTEQTRNYTRKLRLKYQSIMVGIGTILADDPKLTARENRGNDPIRIVIDTSLRIPENAQILKIKTAQTLIYTTDQAEEKKIERLKQFENVEIIKINQKDNQVDLKEVMKDLAKREIGSILLEGGGTLNYNMLKENLVQKVVAVISPKIIGGKDAKTPVEGKGIEKIQDSIEIIQPYKASIIQGDIVIEGMIKEKCSQE